MTHRKTCPKRIKNYLMILITPMYKSYFLISFFCITDLCIFIFIAKEASSVSFAKLTSTACQIECWLLFRIHMIILVFQDIVLFYWPPLIIFSPYLFLHFPYQLCIVPELLINHILLRTHIKELSRNYQNSVNLYLIPNSQDVLRAK